MRPNIQLLKDVLQLEADSILRVSQLLSADTEEKLIEFFEQLTRGHGSLIFCGVGKSGMVAQKLASTFSSLGLSSWFLHPTEALHGDLGKVKKEDSIIFLSKSGTTEEIVKLLPFLKQQKHQLLGLLGEVNGTIAKNCGLVLNTSVLREAGLNNLAPTTSTTVAMAMGDALAVFYESFIGLSKEDFAQHHPGGKLGKALSLKVTHIMIKNELCPCVNESTPMKEVLLLMTKFPTGLCAVLSENRLLKGIIVEADIRRALSSERPILTLEAKELMNPHPIVIDEQALVVDAIKLMENPKRPVYVIPVVSQEQREFLGVITMHDIAKEGLK